MGSTSHRFCTAAVMAIALATLASGCGGGGGGGGSTTTPMDLGPLYRLQSGVYNVSNLMMVGSDTCMQNLDATNFTTLSVSNDGQGNLSLGSSNRPGFADPYLHSQGSGIFVDSYHATTNLETDVNSNGCMYHLVRADTVTLTADNTLDVAYMQTQTMHVGTCAVTTDCTSAYHFTLTKPIQ